MRDAVLFAVLLVATAANAEVTSKYDRFKNRTEVTSSKEGVSSGTGMLNLMWGFRYPGEKMQARPGNVEFIIFVFNKSWEYLRCHSVAFLADGKPVSVEGSKHSGDVRQGFIVETIIANLRADAVSQLANAQKVEMQICRTEYTFDDGDMKVLREFAQATNVSRP